MPTRAKLRSLVALAIVAALAGKPNQRAAPGPIHLGRLTRANQEREPAHGAFIRGDPVRAGAVRTTCPPLRAPDTSGVVYSPHGDTLFATTCQLAWYIALDSGDGARWASATYRHRYIYSHDTAMTGAATRDTVTVDDAVLFTVDPGDLLRPVWHNTYDRRDTWELDLAAAQQQGGLLLSLQYCVNGTGGCRQDFMMRRDGLWADVPQAFLKQLPRSMHDKFWKGIRIDVHSLHADAPLYRDRDANCCASRQIWMDLGLRGDSLVLRRYHVAPTPRDSSDR